MHLPIKKKKKRRNQIYQYDYTDQIYFLFFFSFFFHLIPVKVLPSRTRITVVLDDPVRGVEMWTDSALVNYI